MRIRSIKPDFFIDEDLQDLEIANPGRYVMLVFAGLWGACDKQGVFEWRPRSLKLHILPFLEYNLAETLELLQDAGFIERFEAAGKEYGFIPTFGKHQRITGKEAQEASKYPAPHTGKQPGSDKEKAGETPGKNQGNIGETPETTGREGKGREKEGKETAAVETESVRTDSEPPQPEPENAAAMQRMRVSECRELVRKYLGQLMDSPGQVTILQDICHLYPPERIREAFEAAAGANKTHLNWVKKRLEGRSDDDGRGPARGAVKAGGKATGIRPPSPADADWLGTGGT